MADFKDSKTFVTEKGVQTTIIEPAIIKAGWNKETQVYEDYSVREKGIRVDYLLHKKEHLPLAIVEVISSIHPTGVRIHQAIEYGGTLGVPFVYCSNGSCFEEHDNITGAERTVALDEFPSPEELHQRWVKNAFIASEWKY